jgi:hypothetical protein
MNDDLIPPEKPVEPCAKYNGGNNGKDELDFAQAAFSKKAKTVVIVIVWMVIIESFSLFAEHLAEFCSGIFEMVFHWISLCGQLLVFAVPLSKAFKKRRVFWAIIAFCCLVLFFIVSAHVLKETSVKDKPATSDELKNGIAEIKATISKSVSNLSVFGDTNEPQYIGYSFNLLFKINEFTEGKNTYIFDFTKDGEEKNRLSAYIDTDKNICFRVFDEDSRSDLIKVPSALGTFGLNQFIYLCCEFGMTNDFSFIRVFINGIEMDEHHQNPPMNIILGMNGRFGADFKNGNKANIIPRDMIIYRMTIKPLVKIFWLQMMNDELKNIKAPGPVEKLLTPFMRYPSSNELILPSQ